VSQPSFEQFQALSIRALRHLFIRRIPGIDVAYDKAEAVRRLDKVHREIRHELGIGDWPLITAEQLHGDQIAVVDGPIAGDREFAGCDGLITKQRRVTLGIRVADCCAVYIFDPKAPAIGLAHSGKKGTELGIVPKTIEQMITRFGSSPGDLIVQLSPCIRPPHYEIDFAPNIIDQAKSFGVEQIHDSGICTACDLDRYYSYRAEKGKTGRMLAVLALE
jgi:polyphenol oxidase